MNIYIAGPMRGYPEFNFAAFDAAEAALTASGHSVFSPAQNDRDSWGFNPTGMAGTDAELERVGFPLRAALLADLQYICTTADAIALLDGWDDSAGARAEVTVAIAVGIPHGPVSAFLQ